MRLPHKTMYALRDILVAAKRSRAEMEEILRWIKRDQLEAKGRYDTERLARLGELSQMMSELALEIAKLERLAADAREGIYEPPDEKE